MKKPLCLNTAEGYQFPASVSLESCTGWMLVQGWVGGSFTNDICLKTSWVPRGDYDRNYEERPDLSWEVRGWRWHPGAKQEMSSSNENEGNCCLCCLWGNMLKDRLTPGQTENLKGSDFHFYPAAFGCSPLYQDHSTTHHIFLSIRIKHLPDERRLPLLPLIILPLLPMLASFEVLSVPVSVRSIAISLRLLAAWILDCTGHNRS